MPDTFRTEAWRIAKYILISLAVNLPLMLISSAVIVPAATGSGEPGRLLSLWSYAQLLLSTTVACLMHRYFTFRASEKWYIALPMMLAFACLTQFLTSFVMSISARYGTEAVLTTSRILSAVNPLLAYLFQRYVIYCHTTDQGGWYRRMHPDHPAEEVTP